jgi:hypothetical protein
MNCTCLLCRKGVRITVTQVFEAERRWLGPISIRALGRMAWVERDFLEAVLAEMVQLGTLILMLDHPKAQRKPTAVYLLTRLTVPTRSRMGGGDA